MKANLRKSTPVVRILEKVPFNRATVDGNVYEREMVLENDYGCYEHKLTLK